MYVSERANFKMVVMNEWMDGRKEGRKDGWIGGWVDGCRPRGGNTKQKIFSLYYAGYY